MDHVRCIKIVRKEVVRLAASVVLHKVLLQAVAFVES